MAVYLIKHPPQTYPQVGLYGYLGIVFVVFFYASRRFVGKSSQQNSVYGAAFGRHGYGGEVAAAPGGTETQQQLVVGARRPFHG